MKLKSLTLTHFRGIRDLRLEFSDHVNVLAGVNGAGKTAVLDCAAIMLSRLVGRIRSTKGTGRFFSEYDITNGMSETHSVIEIVFKDILVDWRVSKTRRGRIRQSITGLEGVKTVVDFIHMRLDEDESLSLPIAVYYPTNRAVVDIPLRIRKTHPFDQLSAYDQSLSGKWRSFRIFLSGSEIVKTWRMNVAWKHPSFVIGNCKQCEPLSSDFFPVSVGSESGEHHCAWW